MEKKVISDVVKEVATMSGSGVVDGGVSIGEGGTALLTKAGGYILTRGGVRILVK